MTASLRHGLRLISLWIVWLLAMLFHVDLGLMPLFHGQSAEIHGQVPLQQLPLLFNAMLGYFLLPLFALVVTGYAITSPQPARWRPWRRCQFWFSVVYALSNLPHLLADILIPDARADQIVLMGAMTLIGLLISWESWCWWRQPQAPLQ
jgi:hypothetical protein